MRVCWILCVVTLAGGCSSTPASSAEAQGAAHGGSPATAGPTTGGSGADSSAVLATVNGTPITEHEVRAAVGADLSKLETQAYQLKRKQVDALIDARLMAAEAARRGQSVEAFEQAEIAAKVSAVSDAEIDAFVAANRARIRGDAAQLRPQIREFLVNRKADERRAVVVDGLRATARVEVTLAAPATWRATLDLEGAPIRGSETAPVTIVEYSDFHCPFCRSVQPTLTALLDRYQGRVRLVYKHLPLDSLHPQARRVSEAAYCAGQQQKFWSFHDAVYADTTSDASDATLARFAQAAGLDGGTFSTCLAAPQTKAAIERDVQQGADLGLTGTPGFFVNGRELNGAQPLQAFVDVIEEELSGARR